MQKIIGVIAATLITFSAFPALAGAAAADTSADAQCNPITTTKCGCGLVFDQKTGACERGDNKYQCICSQSDANVVTTGICQADGICHAISTGGKTPEKPSQQVQSNTGQQGSASPPQVSPDTKTLTPSTNGQQSILTNPAANQTNLPAPGQSLFQDALQQLQQMAGGGSTQNGSLGGDNFSSSPETGVPLWLSSGQVQLTPPETSGGSPVNYSGDMPIESSGSFNIGQSGLGTLGPSAQDAAYANTYVTAQTPAEQAVNAAQTIGQGIADTGGSWAQNALQYFNNQESLNAQQDFLTTYGVCYTASGCNAVEGAPTTYTAHPDANGNMTNNIFTLDGYARGDYPYVTVAGPRDQQGDTGVISQVTYTDPWSGQTQTLRNVPYMVADTGSSKYFPSDNSTASETGGNHFDVPIDIPPSDYPRVTGNSSALNAILNTQPFTNSVASVIPTDTLQQSYALSNPWNNPASGGLPSYALQDAASYPQSDFAWAQSVPEITQLASVQSNPQIASDASAPSVDNGPAYPAGEVTSSPMPPALTNEQIAAQIPTPQEVQTNPQQVIEATNAQEAQFAAQVENTTLSVRLAQADSETAAYQQALLDAPSQIPTPYMVQQSGEDLTNQVARQAAAETPVVQSVPTPSVESSALPAPQPSLSDQISHAVSSAGDYVKNSFQSSLGSLREFAINREIPVPDTSVQSGQEVTAQIQQTVANEAQQQLPDVTNADRSFSAIGTNATLSDAANGTHISSDLLSPDTLSTGAGTALTSQFTPGTGDATLSQTPPLPQPRPAEAGPTGINIAGCGGVCEFNNTGADVKAIQQFLNTKGANLAVDGIYGSQTENAVAAFQKTQKIAVDGIVGPQTVAAMNQTAQENPTGQSSPAQGSQQVQHQNTPLPQPRPSAADQAAQQSQQEQSSEPTAAKPTLTPMQQQAQRVQNAFDASYGAYKAFLSNPTDQSLARLVSSVQRTQAIGSQFQNATVQNIASQLSGIQQASGHSPWLVSSYLSSYQSQITGGFNAVRQALSRYLH